MKPVKALQLNNLLTVPRRCIFCGSFMLFLSCFVMVSCASRADLLALVGDVLL